MGDNDRRAAKENVTDGAELSDVDLEKVSAGIGLTTAPPRIHAAPTSSLLLGRDVQSGDPHVDE